MTSLLLCVALISLVVGGVGIMNIMLVSVTERTREIGLRMAVGARAGDILRQFLVEAVVLCFCGGIVGILLGRGGSLLVSVPELADRDLAAAIVAAVVVSVSVGIIFGFYPAWKASASTRSRPCGTNSMKKKVQIKPHNSFYELSRNMK